MTIHTLLIGIAILCVVSLVLAVLGAAAGTLLRMGLARRYAPSWIAASAAGVFVGLIGPFLLVVWFVAALTGGVDAQNGSIFDAVVASILGSGPALFGLSILFAPIVAFVTAFLFTRPPREG